MVPKSDKHKYLVKRKGVKGTEILCWDKDREFFFDDHFLDDYEFDDIELIMILPNSPEENDTK